MSHELVVELASLDAAGAFLFYVSDWYRNAGCIVEVELTIVQDFLITLLFVNFQNAHIR